jgi:hypothetical protein
MVTREKSQAREQVEMLSIESLVPKNYVLRDIDQAINFDFIYDIVKDLYCSDNGRPSVDPVVLFKIIFLKFLFGIRSMRQTIKEIEVKQHHQPGGLSGIQEQSKDMLGLSIPASMHRKQELSKGRHPSCLGRLHRAGGGCAALAGGQGNLFHARTDD